MESLPRRPSCSPLHSRRPVNIPLDNLQQTRPCNGALYLLIVLFGINSQLATNSIWVQLPAIMPQVPERTSLTVYLVGILACSNLATLVYILVKKYTSHSLSEVPFIYSSYALSLTALFLTALFWQTHTRLTDSQHSFILLVCALLAALVSSVATVTYIPFCGKIRAEYVTAVIMGNIMAAAVPHLMALGQGISETPNCSLYTSIYNNNKTSDRTHYRSDHSTTQAPLLLPTLRFQEKFFFFAMAGVVFISGIAFIVARQLTLQNAFNYDVTSPVDDELWQGHVEAAPRDGNVILDDGSILHNEEPHMIGQHNRGQRLNSQESQGQSSIITQSSQYSNPRSSILYSSGSQSTSKYTSRPPTFPLLIMITFWATCVSNGPLSSIKAHACYPSGNNYFLSGVLIANFIKALSCPLSLKLYPRSRITVIVALTSLATITLAYFAALIGFNHTMGSKDSFIFKSTGELLGTIAWITVVGLFSLALSTIGAVCAEAGENYLMWFSLAVQGGSSVGTLFMVNNINICEIYRDLYSC